MIPSPAVTAAEDETPLRQCGECEGGGWTMVPGSTGEPVQQQCRDCYGTGLLDPAPVVAAVPAEEEK